eukprot:TRINITY_DN1880_c0_g1_i1.p1 TRINITY_DN1880_c0_g1~~TRINITY_DN1880_c0_g1_i1.p1  ORF type:complete len:626 (-),score=216.45 TRINITY_DN1880_c0_g1_i1:214-2091(-)
MCIRDRLEAEADKRAAVAAPDEESDDDFGPMPAPKKKRKVLAHEQLFLDDLPASEMYEISYMHRDVVTHVLASKKGFVITGSSDGQLKFWSKATGFGIEAVKQFRAHLSGFSAMALSADGDWLATASFDKSVKVFDVVNFDMVNIIELDFVPSSIAFLSDSRSARMELAVADSTSSVIRVFDANSAGAEPLSTVELHSAPVALISVNHKANVAVSVDKRGLMHYWSTRDHKLPSGLGFSMYSQTDLYEFAKAKVVPWCITFSPDGSLFATHSPDLKVRVFRFETGKLYRMYDESTTQYQEAQKRSESMYKLDNIDFGRRMAVEREAMGAINMGKPEELKGGMPNVIFDASGNFIMFATILGIKLINLHTNKLARLLGKVENTERFLQLQLHQDTRGKLNEASMAMTSQEEKVRDPILFTTAYKKPRFYCFTRREPEDDDENDPDSGRDVFNEKPTQEDLEGHQQQQVAKLGNVAKIGTTMGDIIVKLFPDETPKTVENFVTHSRDGYYDDLIFHRVIKGFMVQTGDPQGDGTGGKSIWGGEFGDEFARSLRHDRPYTVSMANAGPNTNGSQFFITTIPTPWLDNKHTVFGRVVGGMDVVQAIEKVKTDKGDKPWTDIKIVRIQIE